MSDSHDFLVKQEEWERQSSNVSNTQSFLNSRYLNDAASVSSSSVDGQSVNNQAGNPSLTSKNRQIQSNQSSYSTQTSQSTISHPRDSLNQSANQSNVNDLLDLDDDPVRENEDAQAINQFIKKTYDMVNDASTSEIVSWDDDGESFIVKKEFEFSSIVLPRYFRHRNFSSFVRQLNFYSFHKRSHAGKFTKFQHPYFRRNQANLLHLIKRKSTEATANFKDNIANLSAVVTDLKRQYDEIFTIQQHILCIFERYMKAYPLPLKDLQSINLSINRTNLVNPLVKDLALLGANTSVSPPLDERAAKRPRLVEDLTGSNVSPPLQLSGLSNSDMVDAIADVRHTSLAPTFHPGLSSATIPTFSSSAQSVVPTLSSIIDPALYPSIDPSTIGALNASIAHATQQQLATQSIPQVSRPIVNPPLNPALNPSLASLAASIYSLIDHQQVPTTTPFVQSINPPPMTQAAQPQLSAATLDFLSRSINQSINQSNQPLSHSELLRLLSHAAPSNLSNRLDAIHAESNEQDEDSYECDDSSGSPLHPISNRSANQPSIHNRRDGYLSSMNQSIGQAGTFNGGYDRMQNLQHQSLQHQPVQQQQRFSSMHAKTEPVDPYYSQPSVRPINHSLNHSINPIHVHNTCAPSTSMAASTSSFDQSVNHSINHSMRQVNNQPVTQAIHPSIQAALEQFQLLNKLDPSLQHTLNQANNQAINHNMNHTISHTMNNMNHTMPQTLDSLLPYKHSNNMPTNQPFNHPFNQPTTHTQSQDATAQAIDLASRLQIIANVTRQLQSIQSNAQINNLPLNSVAPIHMNTTQHLYSHTSPSLSHSHMSVRSLSRDPSPNLVSPNGMTSMMYDDQSMLNPSRDYLNRSNSLLLDHSLTSASFSPSMDSMYPYLASTILPVPKRR